jgi:putative NADPH-quinone reductase
MPRRIVIIQGHPDSAPERFCRALASAYERGAWSAGHEVRRIDVTALQFDVLRSQAEWEAPVRFPDIEKAQADIGWAEHIVLVYPLWLGTMPALLKAFLEQVMRGGFAIPRDSEKWPVGLLKGRSARIVVTMGMPALLYRWYFGAHSLKNLERNILKFVGIKPIRETLIGMVWVNDDAKCEKWLVKMEALGRAGK